MAATFDMLGARSDQQHQQEEKNATEVEQFDEDEKSREFDERDSSFAFAGGNRWSHDETSTLIKLRSEIDPLFRESAAKAPLWDEVSRKMADRGFNRSAKKCKEKFENIYKYYRRTKELGQRPNGKTYRFFEQLEAIDHYPLPLTAISPTTIEERLENAGRSLWTSDTNDAMNVDPLSVCINAAVKCPMQDFVNAANTNATNSSTCTNSTNKKRRNKRKFAEFFDNLMQEVMMKQDELQKRFVEAIERYEIERIGREEAWRAQETDRIRREYEFLSHERSVLSAKDAAVIAVLQKISQQEIPSQFPETSIKVPMEKKLAEIDKNTNGDKSESVLQNRSSSSRWPRAEVEALITVRSRFDLHYQESSQKGPLWEEISAAMMKLGYERSSKRCKEKWENINKYFKRVRESDKKRSEDSRTCPYFHLLDNLYKQKAGNYIKLIENENINTIASSVIQHNESPGNEEEEEDDDDQGDEDGENFKVVVNKNNKTHSSTVLIE